jgi:rubrerythrin
MGTSDYEGGEKMAMVKCPHCGYTFDDKAGCIEECPSCGESV